MSLLALSGSIEYLCYGSTATINILILSVQGPSLYDCQNLTYKDGPHAERVKIPILCVYSLLFIFNPSVWRLTFVIRFSHQKLITVLKGYLSLIDIVIYLCCMTGSRSTG